MVTSPTTRTARFTDTRFTDTRFADGAPRAATPEGTSSPAGGHPFDLRHSKALDGLRGLAVAGVLVFHGGYLTGGYLGVDLFFVLSGFLITALLLHERARHGSIDLHAFWVRRARRLLPAVFGLFAGIAVYSLVWARPVEQEGLRGDTLATLFYWANWRSLLSGHGYWELFRTPSPLQHTWSLAIEEQFYVLWPLVVVGVAALASRRNRSVAAAVTAVSTIGALASMTGMVLAAGAGVDTSRLYFGTDTRAGSILAGAAFAAVLSWRGWGRTVAATPWAWSRPRLVLEAAAVLAAAGLGHLWVTLDGQESFLYRGGFVISAVAVTLLIAAAVHPRPGPVAAVLSLAPFRWLGLVSYGLYLWHWPVFVVLQLEHDRLGLDGPALLALKLAVSLALALVSFAVVERPIRNRGLAARRRVTRFLVPVAAAATVLAVIGATLAAPAPPSAAGPGTAAPDLTAPLVVDDPPVATVPGTRPAPAPPAPGDPGDLAMTAPLARPVGRRPRLLVVGDSVAMDLAVGIDARGKAAGRGTTGIQVASRAFPGCLLTTGDGDVRVGEATTPIRQPAPCRTWQADWAGDIARFRPDAVLMHFGGAPEGELRLPSGWEAPCSPAYLDHLRASLDTAVTLLSARGATVFVAPPSYHRSPWHPQTLNDRVDCVAGVYRRAATDHPDRVRLLPLDTWTCPTRDTCKTRVDGVELREDGVHFHHGGRDVVSRWVAEHLFTTAAR